MNTDTVQASLNALNEIERERVDLMHDVRTLALPYGRDNSDRELFMDAVAQAYHHLTDFYVRLHKERIREALDD